jgi:hypothetical protein
MIIPDRVTFLLKEEGYSTVGGFYAGKAVIKK